MATEMEKDVLLELISGAYVTIVESSTADENDLSILGDLKWDLLSKDEADIDYRKTADFIKNLEAKYE